MTGHPDLAYVAAQVACLEEIDREIARLALLCQARILHPGVIERVLQNDTSVCEADNPAAFAKLRGLLFMHFGLWQKSAMEHGPARASLIEQFAIGQTTKSLPGLAARLSGTWHRENG